jgi:Ca2+-binding EF-hand superfamily protein
MVDRLMNFDEDGNGEISKEEMPERMHSMFARADADGNDSITKEEILKMAEKFPGQGGPGGEGRRGGGEDGRRSKRPQRPPVE